MANQETIKRCLQMLGSAYPGTTLTKTTPQLYSRLLEDIPDDVLEAAVLDHIGRSVFYPKVSELRMAAANIASGLGSLPSAMDAWGEVCQQIRQVGYEYFPTFDNPLTTQIVDAMGWRKLCMSENQIADRARFIDAYDELLHRQVKDSVTLPQVRYLTERLALKRQAEEAAQLTDGSNDDHFS